MLPETLCNPRAQIPTTRYEFDKQNHSATYSLTTRKEGKLSGMQSLPVSENPLKPGSQFHSHLRPALFLFRFPSFVAAWQRQSAPINQDMQSTPKEWRSKRKILQSVAQICIAPAICYSRNCIPGYNREKMFS